jgi:biopolymer transport protein ExbB
MTELVHHGGVVLVAIAVLSLMAWFLLLGQWLDLRRCERSCREWERCDIGAGDTARLQQIAVPRVDVVGRLLREGLRCPDPKRLFGLERFEDALAAEQRVLLRHLPLAGATASLTPLLGLLGTILGMMETFGVLAVHSVHDVEWFASGISRALVTTEAGLITALPILMLHGWLRSRAQRCFAEARLCTQRVAAVIWPGLRGNS